MLACGFDRTRLGAAAAAAAFCVGAFRRRVSARLCFAGDATAVVFGV